MLALWKLEGRTSWQSSSSSLAEINLQIDVVLSVSPPLSAHQVHGKSKFVPFLRLVISKVA